MMEELTNSEKWFESMKEKYPYMLKRLYGVDVGKGWYTLLENLFEEIERREKVIESEGKLKIITAEEYQGVEDYHKIYVPLQFVQIKEKFGGLRAYADYGSDNGIQSLIEKAELQSYKVCEDCGTTESTKRQTLRGWIHTLCKECKSNRQKKQGEIL